MTRNRSSLSEARSYKEIGEYWDSHDLADVWGKTRKVEFDVAIESEKTYCAIQKDLPFFKTNELRAKGRIDILEAKKSRLAIALSN